MSIRTQARTANLLAHTLLSLFIVGYSCTAQAQPQGGSVFREYRWTNSGGDAGGSLRVGGRVGYGGGPLQIAQVFDLRYAKRAEVVLEKLLCHDGTRKLEISVNGNPWIAVPESAGIPAPQCDYQHHTYPIAPVPLAQLRDDDKNQIRLRVAEKHPWSWPQNLIYGVHFRIYYDPARKPHASGRMISPTPKATIGKTVTLEVETPNSKSAVQQVDYLGLYDGVNLEGDGQYRQWHYHYVRGELAGHIGSVKQAPWTKTWDTQWIPDQQQPFELAARITDENGVTFQTPSVTGLTFERGGLHVELCRPYDVPKKWVTRASEYTEKFRVAGNLENATAAKLVWCSWSPGYMEGLFVNEQKVLDREGPRYAYFVHHVPITDLSVLRPDENRLTTGKTPKYNGETVHGMEVNWPGIMVLIQYRQKVAPY